ncbi:MAG: hypothetical protein ACREGG_04255 [Candidatus Saccharimonadales bacterium]
MLRIKRAVAAFLGLALLVFASGPFVAAQQAPSGSGLSISPTISQFTISPGGEKSLTLTIKNITVDDVTAQGVINDFTSDNSTGNPKILTDTNTTSPNSIKPFVVNLDNVPLKKGEQKNVIIALAVPKNTAPGAYYGIIRYKAVPASVAAPAPGQVALTASVGSIVLITVPGNLRHQLQLSAVHVYRGAHEGSLFFTRPNKIGVEVKNFGNGFEQPFGNVEVQNMFGKSVGNFQYNNPKQLGNVLPNSTRNFINNTNLIRQPGRYTITAHVSYGSGSQILTLSKTVWYIPAWLAIVIALVILALLFLAYRAYRRYKHSQRHSGS